MVLDTRKNLNSGKFEQVSGDTLNLSGSTNIYKDIVVKSSGDLTIEKYSGTTNKMLEVGLNGIVVANSDIVSGKIVNPVTIGLLTDDDNWSVNGNYIGFDIIDTYEGQYYKDDNYYYFAYSDNSWSRVSLKTLTKENVIGLTLSDNPTFSDVVIPDIAEASSYTASAWAWLTGLFGTVTGSVKAMLVALVERVASLDERVGELEDAYLVKVQVEQDVAIIELSQDKNGRPFDFKEGEKLSVLIQVKDYGASLGRIVITINDVTSPVYNIATSQNITNFITAGTRYKKQYTTFNFALVGTEIQGELFTDYTTETGLKSYQYYTFYTDGLNCFNIRKLNLTAQGTLIPAGSVIIIKRI